VRVDVRALTRYRVVMSDVVRVSAAEAHAKMQEGWVYVDVRTEAEFAEGHPAEAFNVPGPTGASPNPDFLRVMSARFPRDARIIIGCRSGVRSLRAARALVEAGFTNVVDQRAGWDGVRDPFGQITEPGWSRVGLPSEEEASAGRAYAELKGS
jgi:rhodanese-related sulfurtransferase